MRTSIWQGLSTTLPSLDAPDLSTDSPLDLYGRAISKERFEWWGRRFFLSNQEYARQQAFINQVGNYWDKGCLLADAVSFFDVSEDEFLAALESYQIEQRAFYSFRRTGYELLQLLKTPVQPKDTQ